MADIGTVTVNLSPTIDTGALAASIRSAVADALEQVAGELRAEVPTPRWTIGQALTEADLDELPVGAVVRDRDSDQSAKTTNSRGPWLRNNTAYYPAEEILRFPPVTLVSLP